MLLRCLAEKICGPLCRISTVPMPNDVLRGSAPERMWREFLVANAIAKISYAMSEIIGFDGLVVYWVCAEECILRQCSLAEGRFPRRLRGRKLRVDI